jgi:hypothetical protein
VWLPVPLDAGVLGEGALGAAPVLLGAVAVL